MIDLGRSCARHRPPLVDFVDRGEVGPGTAAALSHLDRCASCTEAIEATMLAITALRRLGAEAAAIEPPADAWPRLRFRIEAWRRPPRVMSPIAGMALSMAMVAVLIMPATVDGLLGTAAAPAAPATGSPAGALDSRIEAEYINAVHRPDRAAADGPRTFVAAASSYPRIYPDNYRPTRKEVGPAEPTGRPPEAI